ncbi:hypothetical protein SAMN05216232_3546 [Virgibacillus subterraneus]|uniref:Uncharacterized protein n=1 Tax=Virgibacillus subterraneus TaxID=621109 RepID=A0A1H9JMM6_9BACI|nr:putative holin-like toxin [Virgibacillus subterraneus]SEQ88013.1 hypothetical protein SAMN05216232_3546 [Virgibacillus subterraneus]
MTTFEALSLVAQFSISLIATLTLIVTIVVYLRTKALELDVADSEVQLSTALKFYYFLYKQKEVTAP